MDKNECQFCDPINRWPKSHIVGSLKSSIVLLSQDQYFYGWCLVVYKTHFIDLFDLSIDERAALEADTSIVSKAIQKLFSPDIMNYAAFGNIIPHLHWNVIPRYKNDGLWGTPPWPHKSKKLTDIEAENLAKQIREVTGATL
jgi:diadenosine tetraphosphate (Ap4A) HIT family hydrolase